jgi:hypothetical protein
MLSIQGRTTKLSLIEARAAQPLADLAKPPLERFTHAAEWALPGMAAHLWNGILQRCELPTG